MIWYTSYSRPPPSSLPCILLPLPLPLPLLPPPLPPHPSPKHQKRPACIGLLQWKITFYIGLWKLSAQENGLITGLSQTLGRVPLWRFRSILILLYLVDKSRVNLTRYILNHSFGLTILCETEDFFYVCVVFQKGLRCIYASKKLQRIWVGPCHTNSRCSCWRMGIILGGK